MSNNAKRKSSGKFAVNPNSKAQKLKREREAARAAALNGGEPQNTAKPTDATEKPAPQETPETSEAEPSHVDSYFPEPAEQQPLSPELYPTESDESDEPETKDKPRPSRAKRARAKMLAEQLVKGTDGIFGMYVGARHGQWLKNVQAGLRSDNQIEQAEMLGRLSTLSDTERTVLIESIARYIEENNIEMSPGTELAVLMGSMYIGRIMALEATLMAVKKGNIG